MRRLLIAVLLLSTFAFSQRDPVLADWEKDNTIELIMVNWYEGLASYAELHSMDDVIATGTDSTDKKLTDWTIGTYKNTTPDTTGNVIFTKAGVYFVFWSASFTHSVNNTICHIHPYKNSTHLPNLAAQRKVGTAADVGSMGAMGLVTVAIGDTLTLRVSGNKSGNITLHHSNFSMVRLR